MARITTLEHAVKAISTYPEDRINLVDLGELINMSPRTLAEQIKRKKIKAALSGNRYHVEKAEALRLAEQNESKIRGWNRLVDVCKQTGIHRNIGESICRQYTIPCALDLNGHMRVPREGEKQIKAWVSDKKRKKDWVRKTEFAKSIGEHPTLIDTVCRKLNLPIDHDMSGLVILSPEAQAGFMEWRERRDLHRNGVIESGGKKYYSLAKTAEDAARYFAEEGKPDFEKVAKTYYRRFSFWIQEGLPYKTLKGKKYFTNTVYKELIDDLSVAEAARVAGVCKTTIKSWIRSGSLTTKRGVAKRRSLSKKQFTLALKEKYERSPVLKKKDRIPVKILPELDEWADRIKLRGREGVIKALKEATGLSDAELYPLQSGCGIVPRLVKMTYDEWCIKRECGMQVEIHPDYQGYSSSRIHELAGDILEQRLVADKNVFCGMIAVYTGADVDAAEKWLFDSEYEGFMNFDLGELLRKLIEHQGARVYADHLEFAINDLLIHPHSRDYGVVSQVLDHKTIRVEWKNLGAVTMAHCAGASVEQYQVAMAR
jgi:predicted site-specific integrase-resolvase